MEILLNNKPDKIEGFKKLTVKELLNLKKYTYKMLIVRVNDKTVKSDDYEKTYIKEGDNVAVIHLMTGG
ncbi:MAG: sulfur carrier protein ThiS [Bacteroidetes bacterium]|nr:MAG: sulfur carrier protein ThiS [Bacteroidota bacterium]